MPRDLIEMQDSSYAGVRPLSSQKEEEKGWGLSTCPACVSAYIPSCTRPPSQRASLPPSLAFSSPSRRVASPLLLSKACTRRASRSRPPLSPRPLPLIGSPSSLCGRKEGGEGGEEGEEGGRRPKATDRWARPTAGVKAHPAVLSVWWERWWWGRECGCLWLEDKCS